MGKRYDFETRPVEFKELQEPKLYKQFVKVACNYSDCICLSFEPADYDVFLNSKWGFLKESVIRYEYTTESYVTKGPEVLMLYMRIDHNTYKWLFGKNGIYDFMDCESKKKDYYYLYDLCFIKEHKLLFCSCTHERFCYVDSKLKNLFELKE